MVINNIIVAAIEVAKIEFQGADWCHAFIRDGKAVPGEYCEGGSLGCQYCREVEQAADEADLLAEQAIEEVERGDLREAERLLEQAVRLEHTWGDAPAYGPPLRMLRAALGE